MADKKLEKEVADALRKTEAERKKSLLKDVADKDGDWREWGGDENGSRKS